MPPAGRKPSQVIRTQNETNEIVIPWRERVDNQWAPQNQIHKILYLERKKQQKILSSFLDHLLHTDSGDLKLKRILTFGWLLPVFPGCPLQSPEPVGVKVETVALVSTRILQNFPLFLILVSPWLFKWMMGSSLLKNPSESCMWKGINGDYVWGHSIWCRRIKENKKKTF